MSGENWRTDPRRDETTSRYVKGITSSDWRQSTPRRMGQNPGTPNYAPQASTIHFMGDRSRYEYTPGTVALVWNFTEDFSAMDPSKIDRQKEDLLTSNIPGTKGLNVFVKSRMVIVIACFTDHYVALPIYTHKGLGLTSKIEMKHEYVSIRNKPGLDHYSEPETVHGCIYTTTTAQEATGARVIAPHANVWFAYPQALSYRKRVIFVGELDPGSLSKLCELYMMAMKKALSTTLTRVDHSLWSDAPYSLGSETRQRLVDHAGSEKQKSLANSVQPANQTYSGAAQCKPNGSVVTGKTIPGETQAQTYSDAVTGQTVSGAATGRTSTGFQPLKRPQTPEPLNDIPANPAKRAKMSLDMGALTQREG